MPALPNSPKHIFESSIPINTLTYKCLAKLATNEFLSTSSSSSSSSSLLKLTPPSPPSNIINSSQSLLSPSSPSSFPSSSSSSPSSLSPSPPPSPPSSSPPSSVPQSFSSSNNEPSSVPSLLQAIPTNPLGDFQNLPIIIRQFIVDYVTRKRLKISCQCLCDLLSDGGLYSIDLWQLSDFNIFGEAEMMKILSTMNQNCYNLRQLTLGGANWFYKSRVINGPMRSLFKDNSLTRLQCLKLQQTSSPELIAILKSCPNLVRLEISYHSLTDKEIVNMYEQLHQTCYDSVRHSLRDLRLPESVQKTGIIKMINLFPNLVFLDCCHYDDVLEAIESERDETYGDYDLNELKTAANILANLKGLTISTPMGKDAVNLLVKLSPNLQELVLEISSLMFLFPIGDLKYLARLTLYNSDIFPASFLQQVLPLLQRIGHHLQALDLNGFDVDLAKCARFCPNLKHFSGGWFTILSFTPTTNNHPITKQERANLQQPFSHLQTLRLRPRLRHNVGVNAIVYILTNATNIESIELYSCPDLTDEQLIGLIKNNSLRNLRSLILRHGHFLSKSCLDQLVLSLDKLSFLDCGAPPLSKAELQVN